MGLTEADLTYIAEELGRRESPPLRWLAILATHESPIVREGVVYGLAPHATVPRARAVLCAMAESDPSPGVRLAAREAMEI